MNTKTIFKMLAAAMLMPAMLLTTACSSDDDAVNDNANNQKKYYEIPVTVTVSRQGDEGTRAVYDNNKLSFSTGDKLFVNGHHETAGFFAGALDLLSASDGTFEGTVIAQVPYTGTAEAFLKETGTHAFATLLPAGYENYDYLKFTLNDTPVDEITSPFTSVSAIIENSLLPLGKAEAVAQLSHEYASDYNDYVFALSPQRPVICCTISGLTANTSVSVVYDGTSTDISGNITTDGDGTATFAFTDFTGDNLGTLTVDDNAITLPSNIQLEAGKVYKINRSAAPAGPTAKAAAEATAEDKGKLIGTDGNIYADVAAATAAGTTAVAKIIYLGTTGHSTYTHGLALALTDEASKMEWQDAIDACSAKNTSTPVTGATWLLASKDQWTYMLGTNGAGSYTALRDGFSSVGGSNLQSDESARYWSSTVFDSTQAWRIYFYNGIWNFDYKDDSRYVRACLAF